MRPSRLCVDVASEWEYRTILTSKVAHAAKQTRAKRMDVQAKRRWTRDCFAQHFVDVVVVVVRY
jgi:hypothetical protein